MSHHFDEVDQLAVTTIRTLAIDAVEEANSGHPGAPMGLAPVAFVLFSKFLKHDPADPQWPDRDRFVLSCGHASMLLYSVLHLMGYDLDLEDIKNFRQWQSKTPGHPEIGVVPGAEMTTGPLGQGVATSVGMALAEAHLAATFNRPGHAVVDHRTWVVCSDGDLMEGVSAEAASLAGHLRLDKLVWIWDDNRITIEGKTDITLSDDIPARFRSHGWRVLEVQDANDFEALAEAFETAESGEGKPTLIRVRTHIAYGAPTKQDTAGAHGAPLGADEVRATKAAYGWPHEEPFFVPPEVRERCRQVGQRGKERRSEWKKRLSDWMASEPELAAEWERRLDGRLPESWSDALPTFEEGAKIATRAASGTVLNAIAEKLPELIGGSADLAPSNKTFMSSSGVLQADAFANRNLRFGIREHAMGAILNGLALHAGVRPYGGTFLVFSDYLRPAIRLAALMEQPVIYVFTHDSVWVGEDGPTHQPVEHAMALRTIPDLVVLRPADANETAAAWKVALERTVGPTALLLSRQGLPTLEGARQHGREGVARGAYTVVDAVDEPPAIVLIATGGEVSLAIDAARQLADRGIGARVVSLPSWELFAEQSEAYRREVLPPGIPRLAVEAGVTLGWRDVVGDSGSVIGIDRFGASAPGAEVAEKLGLSAEALVGEAIQLLGGGS